MPRSSDNTSRANRGLRWCWVATAICALLMSGCALFDIRGPKAKDNDLSAAARALRPKDTNAEPWAVSNEAAAIEKDFGVGR